MKNLFAVIFLFLVFEKPFGQSYQPGQTYFGKGKFVEYDAGHLPIIISAPHDGDLEPDSIPDRTCPNAVTARDIRCLELARQIDTAIWKNTGCRPHVVLCHLHRKKLDCNRSLPEASCDGPTAGAAWNEYQNFIDSAKNAVRSAFSRGIFIDLHGHGHAVQQLELGYLLPQTALQLPDATLDQPFYANQSSIRHLAETNQPDSSFAQTLRGQLAFGTLLRKMGYPAVPSDVKPFPPAGEPYFNGGYNTFRHGSANGGTIDAIQVETNFQGVRDNYTNRKKFAESLSIALRDYLWAFGFGQGFPFCLDIAGDAKPCENGHFEYSTAPFVGCTFIWTVTGGEIVGGQGTAAVEVKWVQPGSASISVNRTCP